MFIPHIILNQKKQPSLLPQKSCFDLHICFKSKKKHHPQYLPATKARDSTGWQNQSKYHCDEITWRVGQLLATRFLEGGRRCVIYTPHFFKKKH